MNKERTYFCQAMNKISCLSIHELFKQFSGVAIADQIETKRIETFINLCDYLRITAKWTKQKFNIDKKQKMDFLGSTKLAVWRAFCRSGFWI